MNPEQVLSIARSCVRKELNSIGHGAITAELVEDLTSEVVVRYYRAVNRDHGARTHGETVRFVALLARNVVVDFVRASARRPETLVDEWDQVAEAPEVDRETVWNADEIATLLLSSAKKKGERGKKIARIYAEIILLAASGRTNAQIADALGLKVDTVRVYRQRIRKRLRAILEGDHG